MKKKYFYLILLVTIVIIFYFKFFLSFEKQLTGKIIYRRFANTYSCTDDNFELNDYRFPPY